MTPHTPGPWALYTDHHPGRVRVMAKMPQGVFILANLDYETVDTSNPVTLANAHLIAAAPEHLALLEEAVGYGAELFEQDEPVEAADLVEWFAEWRGRAKASLARLKEGKV